MMKRCHCQCARPSFRHWFVYTKSSPAEWPMWGLGATWNHWVLDGFWFEHIKVIIELLFRKTSLRRSTRMIKSMFVMRPSVRKMKTQYENSRRCGSADAVCRRAIGVERNGSYLFCEGSSVMLPDLLNIRQYTPTSSSHAGAPIWRALEDVFWPATLNSLARPIMDCITCPMVRLTDNKIHIKFAKSGWAQG